MTKEVGCYNITFCGLSYNNNIPYDMVIIEKFNNNTYIEGSKKVLYFRHERGCIVPVFNTEKEVEKYLQYRNYEKLKVKKSITIDVLKQIKASCKAVVFPNKTLEKTCLADLRLNDKKAIKGITQGIPETWNSEIMEYIERNFTLIFE